MEKGSDDSQSFWKQIYDFLLECGKASTPNDFTDRILDNMSLFLRFDTASAYLLDGSGKLCGQHLRNVEDRWSKIYLAYYINTEDQRYSLFRKEAISNPSGQIMFRTFDWENEKSSEFVPDFVCSRGLKCTCGFGLYDMNNNLRLSVSLDRTHGECFTQEDTNVLRLLIPQLNNIYKNFFYHSYAFKSTEQASLVESLTARESQVAELLCQGASPAQISKILHIAQSTTYKHISNIYEKMNVSSQRELLTLLINHRD